MTGPTQCGICHLLGDIMGEVEVAPNLCRHWRPGCWAEGLGAHVNRCPSPPVCLHMRFTTTWGWRGLTLMDT